MSAHAATQVVVNNGFSDNNGNTQTNWIDNDVTFAGNAGNRAARFNSSDDWLYQVLGSFAAGTVFDGSFDYFKTNNNTNGGNTLTYSLQGSSNGTTDFTTFGSGTINNTHGNGNIAFGSFTLADAGFVRIYFDAQSSNRTSAIDNVNVNVNVTAIPEPGTFAMLLAGLSAVGFIARRRRPQR